MWLNLNAKHKTHFVIVDAVGVCERDKTVSKPLDRQPSVPLDKLLNSVAAGMTGEDVVSTLAARLARLELQIDEGQEKEIAAQADGKTLATLCHDLLNSIDPDQNNRRAVERFDIPADRQPTDEQLAEVERDAMQQALKPFHKPKLRPRFMESTRLFPSALQSKPAIWQCREVSFRESPPAVGTTKTSECAKVLERRNATVFPSGENLGQ
jgi:hypothetical protein